MRFSSASQVAKSASPPHALWHSSSSQEVPPPLPRRAFIGSEVQKYSLSERLVTLWKSLTRLGGNDRSFLGITFEMMSRVMALRVQT